MTGRTWPIAAITALVVVVVGVAAAILLNHHTSTTSRPGGDADFGITGPQPEGANAATAAKYGLTAMFSLQPAQDASTGAGLVRAGQQGWLTGELASAAAAPPATAVRPPTDWATWRDAKDLIAATVKVTGVQQRSADETLVTAQVQQIVQHVDHSSTPWRTLSVSASVVHTPHGWRLAAYQVTG